MNEVVRPKRGFKTRTIINNINYKINEWLKEVAKKDADLAKIIKENYFLTGGAITSMLQGNLPNDYDIYFRNPEVAKRVADFYIKDLIRSDKVSRIETRIINNNQVSIFLKSVGVVGNQDDIDDYKYFEGEPLQSLDDFVAKGKLAGNKKVDYSPVQITCNAITLSGDIQIVLRFVGEPEVVHKSYDFIHTTNYYSPDKGLVLNQEALESILSYELKYIGTEYPIATLFRIRKFLDRGWTISAGELVKIAYDISKLNLDDVSVLNDQLVGVDVAYFHEVISILRKRSDKPIDRTYLFDVINRVFDDASDDWINTREINIECYENLEE